MRESNLLVRWPGQVDWHLSDSYEHRRTECGVEIPQDGCEYGEIGRITTLTGTCHRCYHAACIADQDPAMWKIYYRDVVGQ